ncbi:MAG TPA: lasso peptide biosynthesis B2 protein [Pyrinomonadaceae bacterium]|jgi:hypothetical protein
MLERLSRISRRGAHALNGAAHLFRRDPDSALLLVRMAGWVAALSLLVRVMPLPRILRLMQPRPRPAPKQDAGEVQARLARLLDLLLATDFLCFTPTCWKRAPVLHRYLALRGIDSRIVFGVRKEGDGLLAGHAWLESSGRPLLETRFPEYTRTYSFPA